MAGALIARQLRPQAGYQEKVLSSAADIVISGGAAGLGKTFSLLLEPTRHLSVPGFGGVIFRRTSPQIRNEGGLWDTSKEIYLHVGGESKESVLEWHFPKGTKIKFSHLEHEKNIYDWQGAQIPFIGFDELPHFTERMFFYLLSRNRSACGVQPYMRATCNPDPESWVAKLIGWWIDEKTGYPIPERDGVIRWFIKNGSDYIWGDSAEEVIEKAWFFLEELVEQSGIPARQWVKSITFISGSIYDNKALLNVDPGYVANLLSQDEETQLQLLKGNWHVVISDKDIYDYGAFSGLFNNVYEVEKKRRYITADIALQGSDKFVVWAWEGFEIVDNLIMDKSKGNEVIDGIVSLAKKWKVQNKDIIYDNDGVGGFVDGFIVGAVPFVNIAKALNDEKYEHLKAQCYYKSGARVSRGEMKVSEEVANRMYDDKMTVRQRMMFERKAIKKAKTDSDGKLCIIKKAEMKTKLNGESPDLMDAFMMRELPELGFKFKEAVA